MFNAKLGLIRGDYFVTDSCHPLMKADGLTRQIGVVTDKEFDLDIECDDDFDVIENFTIYFRPNKAGWKKAYHRLRCEFGPEMRYHDAQGPLNLAQRLMLNKRKKG